MKKGITIIFTIGILLIVFILTASLVFVFIFWEKSAFKLSSGIEAKRFMEEGIQQAIWEIDHDDTGYDCYEDTCIKVFRGVEVDNNSDGFVDSKWIYVKDRLGNIIGRYAVLVEDENSKININAVGNLSNMYNEGFSPAEISLLGNILGETQIMEILECRYGKDGLPGKEKVDDNHNSIDVSSDGIDNDGDGFIDEKGEGIDEPAEFDFLYPYGDDRPFFIPEEIKIVKGIGEITYKKIKDFITTFSYDLNKNKYKKKRINLNESDFSTLHSVFSELGYGETHAAQIAVNIIDYRDEDNVPTVKEVVTPQLEKVIGIEMTPYFNEIESILPWETQKVSIGILLVEKGGQFIELFNPYSEFIDIGGWEIKGVLCLPEGTKKLLYKDSESIYGDAVSGETEIDTEHLEKKLKKLNFANTIKLPLNAKIYPHSYYTIGDSVKIGILITSTIVLPLFLPTQDPPNCNHYEPIVMINPGIMGSFSKLLQEIPLFEEINSDFTLKLLDKGGNLIEETMYPIDTTLTTIQKNDPRMRGFSAWFPAPPTPNQMNIVTFQPWIGKEFDITNWEFTWQSSFNIKNKKFSSLGELSFIHKNEQWKTLNFWKEGSDRGIIDYFTTVEDVRKPTYGRLNINTASETSLMCLPLIDREIATAIINGRPYTDISEILGTYKWKILEDQAEKDTEKVNGEKEEEQEEKEEKDTEKEQPSDEEKEAKKKETNRTQLNKQITKYGFDLKDNDLDQMIDIDKEKEMVFSKIINLITVRSNVFSITSTGQKVQDRNKNGKIEYNEILSEKKKKVYYDRNKKKILYKKEL